MMPEIPLYLPVAIAGLVILVGFMGYSLRIISIVSKYKELDEAKRLWVPVMAGGALLLVWSIVDIALWLLGVEDQIILLVSEIVLFTGSCLFVHGTIRTAGFWNRFATDRRKLERMVQELEQDEEKELEALR